MSGQALHAWAAGLPDAVRSMLPEPYSLPRDGLALPMASDAYLTAMKQLREYMMRLRDDTTWRKDLRERVDLHDPRERLCGCFRKRSDSRDSSLLPRSNGEKHMTGMTCVGEEYIEPAFFFERAFAQARDGCIVGCIALDGGDLDVRIFPLDSRL